VTDTARQLPLNRLHARTSFVGWSPTYTTSTVVVDDDDDDDEEADDVDDDATAECVDVVGVVVGVAFDSRASLSRRNMSCSCAAQPPRYLCQANGCCCCCCFSNKKVS
jgi:hypothetical protein